MNPVFLFTEENEYSSDDILTRLSEIYEEHRNTNRATVFGFLFWDSTDHKYQNVIPSDAFRASIDEIITNKISLFTIFTGNSLALNRRTIPSQRINLQMQKVSAPKSVKITSAQIAKDCFGYVGTMNLPALLMFQVENGEIIDQVLIEINSRDVDLAISDLKDILNSAIYALDQIAPENKDNHKEIFDSVERSIESTHSWNLIYRRTKKLGTLVDWALRITGIASIFNFN